MFRKIAEGDVFATTKECATSGPRTAVLADGTIAFEDLNSALRETEESIEEVSRTWHDENFKSFKNKFELDKQKIQPLSKKISEFESGYLCEIEKKLIKYINRG